MAAAQECSSLYSDFNSFTRSEARVIVAGAFRPEGRKPTCLRSLRPSGAVHLILVFPGLTAGATCFRASGPVGQQSLKPVAKGLPRTEGAELFRGHHPQ